MNMIADKCNRCGKVVVKHNQSDSSDMIKTCDCFLYLTDIKNNESSRPTLQLREYCGPDQTRAYCPDCLVAEITEWVDKLKKRGKSDIPLNHIIFGDRVTSPCPVCGK
jgi:hypothetical protein